MRIVVCAKEVLDPDAVNNYALAGRLEIGEDGRTLTQAAIPRLMNAYDEQAIEAALRFLDAGVECAITVVAVGRDPTNILKHAAAMGVEGIVSIPIDVATIDNQAVARVLGAYVRSTGGADLILCGRQASDDDQAVVPALVGEMLAMPVITIARSVDLGSTPEVLRVVRVTPDGEETVEARCPAVVTISNEIGTPRYPTTARKMVARRMKPTVVAADSLGLAADELRPRVLLKRQFVPSVQGNCEFIAGDTPAELAARLIARLREENIL